MAPDCGLNITGPAITIMQGFFVTYCITFTFLLLCLVPFQVQLVTGCDNLRELHCFNIFTSEEYVDHQAQIWKIFQKHQTIPEDIQDLHLHFNDFKNGIEKEFAFLKEATLKNVGNF